MSSSVMGRMGASLSKNRRKLAPMLIAPFLSLFKGRPPLTVHSSFWQRRRPRIVLPIFSSTSFHGPHGPRQWQHVLLVYASGVKATTNCFSNFRIKPTPIVGGDPRLHATPGMRLSKIFFMCFCSLLFKILYVSVKLNHKFSTVVPIIKIESP